jgi:very-short-patch-repair endonuclease
MTQRNSWPHRKVGAIAERQHGLVTRDQLVELGVGRGALEHALHAGHLHRMHPGVYALVGPPALPTLAVERAALLACGENAYLSHGSAAAVWGFRPRGPGSTDVTVVGRESGRQRPGIVIHRTGHLAQIDRRLHSGLRIVSPARALLDIASGLDGRQLERALDQALATGRTSLGAVRAVLREYPHRPGAARLRALASPGRSLTMTRSECEERFLELVRKAGLPSPEVNARVGRFEVDFCWRRQRVIVEIDGYPFHSSQAALERDHRRDAVLQQMGFLVIRILGRELLMASERVLVRVAGALARGERRSDAMTTGNAPVSAAPPQ